MPSYIVKPSPSSSEYVYWSDVVEAPVVMGTREYVAAYIARSRPDDAADERFDRADRTGTSALWPDEQQPFYGWDSRGFIAEQRGWLPRQHLREYTALRLAGDPSAFDLLEPFEEE